MIQNKVRNNEEGKNKINERQWGVWNGEVE